MAIRAFSKPMKRLSPLAFPPIDEAQIMALKALWRGEANADMQVLALNWIVRHACRLGDVSFDDDPHVTSLNEGKRMVGFWLMHIKNTPSASFTAQEKPATKRGTHA